ncbi:phytoene desaturase family protein [Calothrix rhizosoleniae]|uniref:phytoene desaturase family protein n=1 Tax=Calothrix rhizosoleniae TaxID=888997 RepID=UPI000B498633|nr:NAD(P)/FAD-dependent oxidoreductase [Calothrix rhizosoleniae]
MKTTHTARDYDLILIGSGMGALTVASLMAQLRGKRILVLERHFRAGGFTHAFSRKNFHWDVGVHYIGQMGEGGSIRSLFDLITGKGVQWSKMPEPFEKFVYPNLKFDLYGDKKRFIADLVQLFPAEEKAIRQYFQDISKASTALFFHTMRQNGTPVFKLVGWLGKFWNSISLDLTTKEYLDSHFQNPQLKALLVSQWGTYGLPPAQSPFVMHATIVNHYLQGGYYPVGGAGNIADSVQSIVESKGGKFLINREATEILRDRGEVAGVRVRKVNTPNKDEFEEYYAPVVVSNVGAANTYLKLIPPDYPIPFRQSLAEFVRQHPPATNVMVYLGLKDDPRKLGFHGENHWIYEQFDHDAIYEQRSSWIKNGQPVQAYISFPSLKDPQAKTHTAEILTFADYDTFISWQNQQWRHRDTEYKALKQHISQTLIDLVNKHYPGFADIVDYVEVSTPLTNEYFTAHPQGGIYGLSFKSERFQPENLPWTKVKTPLPGLYLTGVDIYMGGIVPAVMSGVMTTSNLPDGISIPQAFAMAAKANRGAGEQGNIKMKSIVES